MSLKISAISGIKWTTVSAVTNAVLHFMQLTIMARILPVEDFGLMGMLLVVNGFAQAYADMGISNAIIYRQVVTPNQLSSLYWLNIGAGVVVFGTLVFATPLIAWFYREPRLNALVHWSACALLITPIGQQFEVVLRKELRFRALSICKMVSNVSGFLTAVTAASLGVGVYALIWGVLTTAAISSLILIGLGWPIQHPRLHFDYRDTKGFLKFGLYQMGERSINYFNSNLDQLIIGRLLGAGALGYYTLAWNLVIQPVARINPIVAQVAFPVLARMQDQPQSLRSAYLKMIRLLSTINFGILLGIFAVAPVLIPEAFGRQWVPAVKLVQILAFVSLLRAVMNPVGSLLLARGRADLGFYWNLVLFFAQGFTVSFGVVLGGMKGIAVGLVILHIAYFFASYRFLISTLIGRCWKDYLGSIVPAFFVSSSMGVIVWLLVEGLSSTMLNPTILLALAISVGVIYYVLLTWVARRNAFNEVLGYLRVPRLNSG